VAHPDRPSPFSSRYSRRSLTRSERRLSADSLAEMTSREFATGACLQVTLESERGLLLVEFNDDERSPRAAFGSVRRKATVVGRQPRRDIGCNANVVFRSMVDALKDVHESFRRGHSSDNAKLRPSFGRQNRLTLSRSLRRVASVAAFAQSARCRNCSLVVRLRGLTSLRPATADSLRWTGCSMIEPAVDMACQPESHGER
jgi:hypothetical protein